MVGFVAIAQTLQDVNCHCRGWLRYLNRLESSNERGIFFKVLAVFIQGGCTNCLQLSSSKHWLQNGSCIDSTFRSTSTDQCVNLINKGDDVAPGPDFLGYLLQSFFKVTTVTRTCNEGAHVQGVELLTAKSLGNISRNNSLS